MIENLRLEVVIKVVSKVEVNYLSNIVVFGMGGGGVFCAGYVTYLVK